jgi:hypothetical protein
MRAEAALSGRYNQGTRHFRYSLSESSLVLQLRTFSRRLPPHSTLRDIASDKALLLEQLLLSPAYAIKLSIKEPIHIPDRYQIVV